MTWEEGVVSFFILMLHREVQTYDDDAFIMETSDESKAAQRQVDVGDY